MWSWNPQDKRIYKTMKVNHVIRLDFIPFTRFLQVIPNEQENVCRNSIVEYYAQKQKHWGNVLEVNEERQVEWYR